MIFSHRPIPLAWIYVHVRVLLSLTISRADRFPPHAIAYSAAHHSENGWLNWIEEWMITESDDIFANAIVIQITNSREFHLQLQLILNIFHLSARNVYMCFPFPYEILGYERKNANHIISLILIYSLISSSAILIVSKCNWMITSSSTSQIECLTVNRLKHTHTHAQDKS